MVAAIHLVVGVGMAGGWNGGLQGIGVYLVMAVARVGSLMVELLACFLDWRSHIVGLVAFGYGDLDAPVRGGVKGSSWLLPAGCIRVW